MSLDPEGRTRLLGGNPIVESAGKKSMLRTNFGGNSLVGSEFSSLATRVSDSRSAGKWEYGQ